MKYGEQYGASLFAFEATMTRLGAFGSDIFEYVFNPYLLVVPILIWVVGRFREKPVARMEEGTLAGVVLPFLVIGATVMALSLSAPAPFFRYLAPLIPFFAILTGLILSMAHGVHRGLGLLLMAALVVFSPIQRFLYEITHDFDGPIEGIVNYLNTHAGSDDVVAITYGDMPLKFYTGLRVVGGLTGEDMTPAANADWVIIRNHVISNKDFQVRKWLIENVDARGYEKITLDYPDSPFENRESPSEHLFRTATDYVPVLIFRKKTSQPGVDS